jgi:ribose 5-phosphate isomerase B
MLYLATDHAGFALKEKIKGWLSEWGVEFTDCGNTKLDPLDDYTDFVAVAAAKVAEDPLNNRAIVLGKTGQGEAVVANRRRGVRAAVLYAYNEDIVKLSRQHGASNVLSLGAGFLSDDEAKQATRLWLDTPFSEEERHIRRIGKIDSA